ncbi:DUF2130 domain-containing protein [Fulvivirgaceae bacterium BMA12]|uniref:DUF2130 domain-containing protein n=1 Tax=Agaribacillus aureus TaxID=3051825 RepID=A0ABT8L8M6_9BACT|nr:DUF2130 domain-containing protein [Fulvivirgaceae bacterium BMA12]
MSNHKNIINCPNCHFEFPVEDAFFNQAEERIKKEYEKKLIDQAAAFNQQKQALANEREAFEKKKLRENEIFQERLVKKLQEEKLRLKEETASEFQQQIKMLQEENEQKKQENTTLKQKELDLLKKERQLKEEQAELELSVQRELSKKRDELAEEIRKKETEKNELKFKEYEKKLEDQRKHLEEMQRKVEQGSMQMQGEVQELAIEEWLMNKFPLDTISEIKKGVRGADCMQTVNTREKQNCGTIYYESKRTKDFQKIWIEKFKNDIRDKGANIGVLVTDTMPEDMDRMGLKEGIWICTFEEFKGLCFVLRESIIQISNTLVVQENKGDKMTMLYDFLTSNEFRLQIEGIVEGFTQMKQDLEKERRSIQGHWKRRETQIEKVLLNTNYMYSTIKGIAGNAIQSVEALELPDADPLSLEEGENEDV